MRESAMPFFKAAGLLDDLSTEKFYDSRIAMQHLQTSNSEFSIGIKKFEVENPILRLLSYSYLLNILGLSILSHPRIEHGAGSGFRLGRHPGLRSGTE